MGCILELSILEVLLGFPGSEIWEVSRPGCWEYERRRREGVMVERRSV